MKRRKGKRLYTTNAFTLWCYLAAHECCHRSLCSCSAQHEQEDNLWPRAINNSDEATVFILILKRTLKYSPP